MLFPYFAIRTKKEGIRPYALGYILAAVGVAVFWLWWASQPVAKPLPEFAIPTANATMVYMGQGQFNSVFVTATPIVIEFPAH